MSFCASDCGNCGQIEDNPPLMAGYLLIYWQLQGGGYMDLISRAAAIDAFMTATSDGDKAEWCRRVLEQLPAAQPEIIRCRYCLMHGVCRFEKAFGLDGYCSQAERG